MPQLRNASSEMDDTSKKNIYELIQAGLYYVDSNREMLNEIAKKLIKNKKKCRKNIAWKKLKL